MTKWEIITAVTCIFKASYTSDFDRKNIDNIVTYHLVKGKVVVNVEQVPPPVALTESSVLVDQQAPEWPRA